MEAIITPKLLIEQAKEFALTSHSNHFYPDGRPYFLHLESVSNLTKKGF